MKIKMLKTYVGFYIRYVFMTQYSVDWFLWRKKIVKNCNGRNYI